jgi:hypothetical protein
VRDNLVSFTMQRVIDQIRASKLPSGMMQFAARGALQVPAAENIEILVHLARHNKVFGELAKMTLAGWDEKASRTAAGDPQTSKEVLDYFVAPENLRPALLPALLENPSVPESELVKLAVSGSPETIEALLKSARVKYLESVLEALKTNRYLKPEQAQQLEQLTAIPGETPAEGAAQAHDESGQNGEPSAKVEASGTVAESGSPEDEETLSAYLKEHAHEIAREGNKPFQATGGVVELLGADYFPVTQQADLATAATKTAGAFGTAGKAAVAHKPAKPDEGKRENALQKISNLDVKGRIQLALKGNKEERSLLIRDGTKVVALAVLEAPKISDGEVERFASQKNVLEAVLRQIPLKRRFMKNYIVVRNLVANPRTPLDLGLNLMKNLLIQDLKNISANKEVSETIRKLALKMYKQKLDAANKK